MEFRLLGPLEVLDEDPVVRLPPRNDARCLPCLLLRSGTTVSGTG